MPGTSQSQIPDQSVKTLLMDSSIENKGGGPAIMTAFRKEGQISALDSFFFCRAHPSKVDRINRGGGGFIHFSRSSRICTVCTCAVSCHHHSRAKKKQKLLLPFVPYFLFRNSFNFLLYSQPLFARASNSQCCKSRLQYDTVPFPPLFSTIVVFLLR